MSHGCFAMSLSVKIAVLTTLSGSIFAFPMFSHVPTFSAVTVNILQPQTSVMIGAKTELAHTTMTRFCHCCLPFAQKRASRTNSTDFVANFWLVSVFVTCCPHRFLILILKNGRGKICYLQGIEVEVSQFTIRRRLFLRCHFR